MVVTVSLQVSYDIDVASPGAAFTDARAKAKQLGDYVNASRVSYSFSFSDPTSPDVDNWADLNMNLNAIVLKVEP